MLHRLTETDRRLALDERRFVQGGINLDEVEVSLEEGGAFDGCDTVLLTMERCGMAPVPVRLDTMRVAVPASLMDVPGTLRFSLTGYVGDEVRATTEMMRADKCGRVVPSGIIGGGPAPQDAAPDLWKQLMDEVDAATAGAEDTLERAEGAAKRAEGAASDAAAASSSAAGSESKASAAASSASDSASSAASSAESAASSATGAGNAKTAAETAKTDAESARDAAETAQKGAESAKTAAEAAKAAAEKAKTDAESARDSAQTAASQAQQSATEAADSAASVADKFITSAKATTLEPGAQATASVEEQVLTIGVPKGDKGDPGDVSAVTAAEGSDLSVSTDEGTVTIDDSALRARIAELENQAANVVTGTSTDLVAHGEDAYAQKPIEVRVKGKTWVNRWPVFNETQSGITASTDDTGLITVKGTSTAEVRSIITRVIPCIPGRTYTVSMTVVPSMEKDGFDVAIDRSNSIVTNDFVSNAYTASMHGASKTFSADDQSALACIIRSDAGLTVNASFRIMLVESDEVPNCFTPPASISSVETGNLVTSGKNLLSSSTFIGESSAQGIINFSLPAGTYTLSCYNAEDWWTGNSDGPWWYVHDADNVFFTVVDMGSPSVGSRSHATFTLPRAGDFTIYTYKAGIVEMATDLQLELGSTATAYEPPTVTTIPLPEVELRSLPNGTCDELVIKADGSCEVERRTGYIASYTDEEVTGEYVSTGNGLDAGASIVYELDEPTTEPQSPVTLPALPAPTFNQYHDADIPSDTSTQYARDINLVLANLESVQAALLGGE